MLRRKLLLILCLLAGLLMVLALAALWGLQVVFADMDHLTTHASRMVATSNALSTTISSVEVELHELQAGRKRHLDDLIESVDRIRRLAQELGDHYGVYEPEIEPVYGHMLVDIEAFERHVGALATGQDAALAMEHNLQAITAAAHMREDILTVTRFGNDHARAEEVVMMRKFRWMVAAIAIGFLVVINTTVLLLLRASGMVLRPVDRLVQASRELAAERFDHRVEAGQNDEFDELARAFNRLAEELQQHEQRRIETLGQVALTLNHELNNAMATIDLQLDLLRRQSGDREAFEKCLRQIHENLSRMGGVVEALKHVRRIVLTDYVGGVKMLDLERSVQASDETTPAAAPAERNA